MPWGHPHAAKSPSESSPGAAGGLSMACFVLGLGHAPGRGRAVPPGCLWMLGSSALCSQAIWRGSRSWTSAIPWVEELSLWHIQRCHRFLCQQEAQTPGQLHSWSSPGASSAVLGACSVSRCCSGTRSAGRMKISPRSGLCCCHCPVPTHSCSLVIDAAHPARLQRLHCHAEDVGDSCRAFMASRGRAGVFCS